MSAKLVKNGSTIKVSGLKAADWNGRTGVIVGLLQEGRFPVEINGDEETAKRVNIKPGNCTVVCSGCLGDPIEGQELRVCSGCRAACYCSAACQKSHWAKHKVRCKKLTADLANLNEIKESGFEDHPTWRVHLTLPQRRTLRTHHARSKCPHAWPVSGQETDAMLSSVSPCFLVVHPNQRFKVELKELPSFRMQYPAGSGNTGNMFPPDQMIPVLREEWRRFGKPPEKYNQEWYVENNRRYQELVPLHAPALAFFAVIREVIYTPLCDMQMRFFYAMPSNQGQMFAWPNGDCIGICPGTGERVMPDDKTVHLLVAYNMQGTVMRGKSVRLVTRIMPRILTLKGYDAMLGPKDDTSFPGWQGNVTSTLVQCFDPQKGGMQPPPDTPITQYQPFYPDVLRILSDGEIRRKRPMTANDAWEEFNNLGRFKALERMLLDEAEMK
jgi:hypothetical protein